MSHRTVSHTGSTINNLMLTFCSRYPLTDALVIVTICQCEHREPESHLSRTVRTKAPQMILYHHFINSSVIITQIIFGLKSHLPRMDWKHLIVLNSMAWWLICHDGELTPSAWNQSGWATGQHHTRRMRFIIFLAAFSSSHPYINL